ncbi:MAG: glucokinase [Deltaproteobacteria bacterium RIFOXYD12_FULL_57_12]|nr:MAG: glucokinase [Deltaproteobacteria bacterium RIFOXYD12_FULL_57_12]
MTNENLLLAGDIGGTKTSLAVISAAASPRHPLAEESFVSLAYPDLESVVGEFLSRTGLVVTRACFGVAGPVVGGRSVITNLPWQIEVEKLQTALRIADVRLINDLVAVAHAVRHLPAEDFCVLNHGQADPAGALAVIAPGTGLGEAFLTRQGARWQAHASEGGHADFAPATPAEVELLRFLWNRLAHVSYEQVCSGIGLPNIYAFFKESGAFDEPVWLAAELAIAVDPVPVIVNAAVNALEPCAICVATVEAFAGILAAEAGNLCLKVLATGGVFIGGGLPPRILSFLKAVRFMETFCRKGRMSGLLSRVPVRVILNPGAALLGAAWYGLDPEAGHGE